MRSALARRPPAVRHPVLAAPGRPVVAPRARRAAPRAIQVGGTTVAFLLAYGALTVWHALGHQPAFAGAIMGVPLFARVVVCALVAPPAGLVAACLAGHRVRVLRAVPAALAAAMGLAVVAILAFA